MQKDYSSKSDQLGFIARFLLTGLVIVAIAPALVSSGDVVLVLLAILLLLGVAVDWYVFIATVFFRFPNSSEEKEYPDPHLIEDDYKDEDHPF